MYDILNTIKEPTDIKKLNTEQLKILADEMREAILHRTSTIGGHVGSNLGIVEATIALHYVFNSPHDKIIWDVSHQSYPHKLLTGRQANFTIDDDMKKISGYANPDESEHDFFKVGHTATSVSLACGVAKARDLMGQSYNVIAVIGDGSLSGGEAMEGLNNAAVLGSNIIIIINDNEMSIAENHGGLYNGLRLLRETNGKAECNMFKALGFEYHYVAEGNDLTNMITALSSLKDTQKPTILHIHTAKGKGYLPAESNKETWHYSAPFNIADGSLQKAKIGETIHDLTYNYLVEKIKKDDAIIAVNAATPAMFGLSPERRAALGKHFVDVGIAEEHAVAFTSALAKSGAKPIYFVVSSFIQRTYDQLSQDLALNNSPAVIVIGRGGISGASVTHLNSFDISMATNIPNIVYLAPTTVEEYMAMLDWAVEQNKYPVIIRQPNQIIHATSPVDTDYNKLNTYKVEMQGNTVAIIAAGSFFKLGADTADELRKHDIQPTLINPRYLTGIDRECLERLKNTHRLVITLEDGQIDGGFGEKIARFYGNSNMKILTYGSFKEFTDRADVSELYNRYHLMPDLIVNDILSILKSE